MAEFTNIVVPEGVTYRSENVKAGAYTNSYNGMVYLEAKAGYRFKTDTKPNIVWTKVINSYGQTQVQNETAVGFYPSDTLYRKSFEYVYKTDSQITFSGDFVEQVTPPPEPAQITISQTLSNCTTNAPEYITDTDSSINITATANAGYIFQETPYLSILKTDGSSDVVRFSVSENKETANVVFNVQAIGFNNIQTFEIVATAVEKPTPPPEPAQITISQTLSNCTTNAPEYITDTDSSINITATANENAVFNIRPFIHYYDWSGILHEILFEVSSDKKTANAVFNVQVIGFENIQSIRITADAEVITPYNGKYGTINVYCVSNENLEEFSTKRFINISGDMQGTEIDMGKYVSALRKVYISIGEVANDVLKCGNYNTNIAVKTPLNDLFTFDCGFITIPSHNRNITDFETQINIFLPFVGFVSLSSQYIGKNIHLEYVCNLITANAVAKLYCDDICFDVYECNISNDIIYKTSDANELNVGSIDFNMNVLKGLTPYAVVKYFDSANNHLYNSACERVKISDVSGFAKFEEITNFENPNITDTEKDTIYSLLNDGVIVS